MARFFGNHTEYETLLTEHLDGRLDEVGEARLRVHIGACAACTADLRDMEAVTAVLRAEPMVEPPRSFALPLAARHPSRQTERASSGAAFPGFLQWAGSGSVAMLRSLQMATAVAALVLTALVGLDLTGLTADQEPATMTALSAPEQGTDIGSPTEHLRSTEPDGVHTLAGDPDPSAEKIDQEVAVVPPSAPSDSAAPTEFSTQPAGRSALEWAKLGLSGLTAMLALGVVSLSWAMYRHPM